MAQPLTAEYRLTLHYTVATLPHKQVTYCEASPSILATSGYFLFDRSGLATIDAGDAAQSWWSAFNNILNTTVAAENWQLEQRTGVVWNEVTAGTLTGAGGSSDAIQNTSQVTISCKTSDVNRIRVIILEQSRLTSNSGKNFGSAGLTAINAALSDAMTGADSDASGFFQWARSRNKKELHATQPIISIVFDLNDRIRRARGYM